MQFCLSPHWSHWNAFNGWKSNRKKGSFFRTIKPLKDTSHRMCVRMSCKTDWYAMEGGQSENTSSKHVPTMAWACYREKNTKSFCNCYTFSVFSILNINALFCVIPTGQTKNIPSLRIIWKCISFYHPHVPCNVIIRCCVVYMLAARFKILLMSCFSLIFLSNIDRKTNHQNGIEKKW